MIQELQNRKSLNEGREFGVGFSILKKVNNNDYQTYLPFTACKDYLNDLVYIEKTKKIINSKIHGYRHDNQNIFDKTRYFYLGVNVLHYNNGGNWSKYEEAENILYNNHENIVKLINKLEDRMGLFKSRTSFIKVDNIENNNGRALILRLPNFWVKYPFLISLITLYIRCFFNVTDFSQNMFNSHKCFINADNYMMDHIKRFLKITKYNIINKYKYDLTVTNLNNIHNNGIQWWLDEFNIAK